MWYAVQSGRIGRIGHDGAITEYTVPGGEAKVPFNIATGPDRNIWFGELLASAVGRVQARPGRGAVHTTLPAPVTHPAPTKHAVPAGHAALRLRLAPGLERLVHARHR